MASSERLASLSPKAYVKLQTPHRFFKVGRVFQSDEELIFVVVREGYSSSTCCELRFLGQSDNVSYNFPNIATLCLPDYPIDSHSDKQFQLILECPVDEISPPYYFDCSKWLLLTHQSQVYKIGRVDRKSIKRLEAMFVATGTTSETGAITTVVRNEMEGTKTETTEISSNEMASTMMESCETESAETQSTKVESTTAHSTTVKSTEVESTTVESTKIESTEMDTSTLETPELYTKPPPTNETTNSTETNQAITSNPNTNRGSKGAGSTEWSVWEYNADRRCYFTSRINERGEEEREYSSTCYPPIEGLEGGIYSAKTIPYRLKLEGEDRTSQEGSILLATGTNAELWPQFAAVHKGGYGCGASGYYNYGYGKLTRATSPLNTALSSVSIGEPWASTFLPSQSPTLSSSGYSYEPQLTYANSASSYTTNSSINAPTQRIAMITCDYTRTDELPHSPLWKEFRMHSSKKFKSGYVFKVVWTEPGGNRRSHRRVKTNFDWVKPSKHGEMSYTSIRRFIILASYSGHSTCLPILTYGGRGTAKPGVKSNHHAIIYTTYGPQITCSNPPSKLDGESELENAPIRIELTSPKHHCDPTSRLNYAKVYTVEHNVKVCFIGKVHKDSYGTFRGDYLKTQDISFSDNTNESDGYDVDLTDREDEALSGNDGALADNKVASADEARSESTVEDPNGRYDSFSENSNPLYKY